MLKTGYDVVAVVYRSRHAKCDPIVWMPEPLTIFEGKNKEPLVKLYHTGLGCTMISRKAIEETGKHFPELKYTSSISKKEGYALYIPIVGGWDVEGGGYFGDDFSFFRRLREAGFHAAALIDAPIKHERFEFNLKDLIKELSKQEIITNK